MLRAFLATLASAYVRALLLAGAAAALSGIDLADLSLFLATWSAVFLPLALAVSIGERPALGLGRPTLAAAAVGLGAGAILWKLLAAVRALGVLGPLALAAGGAAIAAALAPRRDDAPVSRRRRAIAIATPLGVALVALVADPESRYGERYRENRLDAAALAAPAPFPGRDPATLIDLEVAAAVARTWMRTHPPERLRWLWEEAVAVEGLLAYAGAADDADVFGYVRRWVDAHSQEALDVPLWADTCAPAMAVLTLARRAPNPAVDGPIIARVDRYLAEEAPRTLDHVPSHTGLLAGGLLPAQAWVDTLFMHGVYLARRGGVTTTAAPASSDGGGEDRPSVHAQRLVHNMAESLQDERTGLFRHAAVDVGPVAVRFPVEPVFWARGNGWAFHVATSLAAAEKETTGGSGPIERGRRRMTETLLQAQDAASGLWRTDLLGGTDSNPLETSASALFVAGLRRGVAAGVPDLAEAPGRARPEVALAIERGLRGLRAQIRWDGGHPSVLGTTTGTHPGFRAYYRAVRQDENVGHGVGALLLALTPPKP